MKLRLPVLATLCAVVAVIAATQAGSVRAASKATSYLSLGDSLAEGYQPIGARRAPLRRRVTTRLCRPAVQART